jgi:hypothetical protein
MRQPPPLLSRNSSERFRSPSSIRPTKEDLDTEGGSDEARGEQPIAARSSGLALNPVAGFSGWDRMVSPAAPSQATSPADMREEVCILDEGPVVIRYPGRLNAQSFEDLKDWLELILRKAKRLVREKANGSTV